MIPLYRQKDIKAFDDSLASVWRLEEAISRAGYSVFVLAAEMMGGLYGKKVTVLYGPGNNGRDALVASGHLKAAGAVVTEVRQGSHEFYLEETFAGSDLVIDGCFGVGLSRAFESPPIGPDVAVLAVDLPSGLNGDNGCVVGSAIKASSTLCLSGLKLGALISAGPELCGEVYLSELGLGDMGMPELQEYLVEDSDLSTLTFRRTRDDHKWSHAVAVVAGSPGMGGAAHLVCSSAYWVGAGIVHLYTELVGPAGDYGVETVVHPVLLANLDKEGKKAFFQDLAERFKALVVGPGLGLGEEVPELVREAHLGGLLLVLHAHSMPFGPFGDLLAETIRPDHPGVILTPHIGELKKLLERSGSGLLDSFVSKDRCTFAREFAAKSGAALLVKGGPTIVSSTDGKCYLTVAPSSSLAVAGSGDVLSGMIGAALSYDGDVAQLAAVTAHLHGLAGRSMAIGPSGELGRHARDLLRMAERSGMFSQKKSFAKPMRIEGNLVAGSELIGNHPFRRV